MAELIAALEAAGVGGQVIAYVFVGFAAVSLVAKAISIFVADGGGWMAVVNFLAMNGGKARNDPRAQ